jgi:serralysin
MITAAELALLRAFDPNPIPGIDTSTGNPIGASSLTSYATLSTKPSAPVYYIPSQNRVVVNGSGTVLSGYNFSGVHVDVYGSNVTIKDCTFNDMGGTVAAVQQMNTGGSGLTVQNCTFSGGNEPYGILSASGSVSVINNSFIDSPSHPVQLSNGVVTGNYFSGGAYIPGTHADAVNVYNTTGRSRSATISSTGRTTPTPRCPPTMRPESRPTTATRAT